jgi:hypothetical protein
MPTEADALKTPLRVALLLTAFFLAACSEDDEPSDETPDGALKLFIRAMRVGDRENAYRLLAPDTQRQLQGLASQASQQIGRTVEPAEMLAVERFALRWQLSGMSVRASGDRATVIVQGSGDTERAEVETVRVDNRWRVALPI